MTISFAALEEVVDAAMAEEAVPGVAVGILTDGAEHYMARGVTNVHHPLPVTEGTLFQVGSTTKTITATAVLRLVERGPLDLDRPVRSWIPSLKLADEEVAKTVTPRHLLTHTGGWDGDLFVDTGQGDDALPKFSDQLVQLRQLAPLGTWGYQNSAYTLAGHLIEVVTGERYEDAIRELILEPLGMRHSVFFARDGITHAVAVGHRARGGEQEPMAVWELGRAMHPAGGLASSAMDQMIYARFHLGDGRGPRDVRLLSEDALLSMRAPQTEAGGGYAAQMGIGWLLQPTPGLIAHGGSTNGQESSFALVPERGFAITVLTNSESGVGLQRQVTKWALRNIAGVTPARPSLEPLEKEELKRYRGDYVNGGWSVRVETNGTGPAMELAPSEAMRGLVPELPERESVGLELYRGGRFKLTGGSLRGATGEFIALGGSRSTHLRLNGRLLARV